MTDLLLKATEDWRSQVKLRAKDQPVPLSQREMSELFELSPDNVGLHLKNIYDDGELSRKATAKGSSAVQSEGSRHLPSYASMVWPKP